jgi:hypothetical protein
VDDLETKEEALMKLYLYLNCFKEQVLSQQGVFTRALALDSSVPLPPSPSTRTLTWDQNEKYREMLKKKQNERAAAGE